jgi:hypothetical protein
MNRFFAFLSILSICVAVIPAGRAVSDDALQLTIGQSELLHKEPVLVNLRLQPAAVKALPPQPGNGDGGTLRFEFEPGIEPHVVADWRRPGKPLPLEAASATGEVTSRDYELLEWYQIPKEGTFSVRAVFEHDGTRLTSQTVKFTIRAPASDDSEHDPVGRIHHLPWMNSGDGHDRTNRSDAGRGVRETGLPFCKLLLFCTYLPHRFQQEHVGQQYPEISFSCPTYSCWSSLVAAAEEEKANEETIF